MSEHDAWSCFCSARVRRKQESFLQAFLNQSVWIAEVGEEVAPCQHTHTRTHNCFFHPYLLGAAEFLDKPSAESLRYKFNQYKTLPPWQQSKKAQMSRRDGRKKKKLGMYQGWQPQRRSYMRYLSTFSLQQPALAESDPSLSWHNNKPKRINICSWEMPSNPPLLLKSGDCRELCTWQDEVFWVLEGRSRFIAGDEWQPSEPLSHAVMGGSTAVWAALANFYNGAIIHQPSGRRSLYFFCIQPCAGRC